MILRDAVGETMYPLSIREGSTHAVAPPRILDPKHAVERVVKM
jgi:hypothetical protein